MSTDAGDLVFLSFACKPWSLLGQRVRAMREAVSQIWAAGSLAALVSHNAAAGWPSSHARSPRAFRVSVGRDRKAGFAALPALGGFCRLCALGKQQK